jgi:hypothetical protein
LIFTESSIRSVPEKMDTATWRWRQFSDELLSDSLNDEERIS